MDLKKNVESCQNFAFSFKKSIEAPDKLQDPHNSKL